MSKVPVDACLNAMAGAYLAKQDVSFTRSLQAAFGKLAGREEGIAALGGQSMRKE